MTRLWQLRPLLRVLRRQFVMSSKRKSTKASALLTASSIPPDSPHLFVKAEDIRAFHQHLLAWYDVNKRDLPWRRRATDEDINRRAYAVWVSEIMLQQTQVATVIDYYNRWMEKWPTLRDLAKATLEEVNEMWSGLGYYSRGKRLHEGANKVVNELDGEMPRTAAELMRELPGVGRYTAGAIASIAHGQVSSLVDGNVSRVFSRMRRLGADVTGQPVVDALWQIADCVVDPKRPGDFNQALMELGATVCTPKSPSCSQCPVSSLCAAYQQVEAHKKINASRLGQKSNEKVADIEEFECKADDCTLCLPDDEVWQPSQGVMNYPRKGKKKAPREEKTAVVILRRDGTNGIEFLLVQRPGTGLLANLWEFLSVVMSSDDATDEQVVSALQTHTRETFGTSLPEAKKITCVGEVYHIFSHIHQTYLVHHAYISSEDSTRFISDKVPTRWLSRDAFLEAAVSTAMKKVFKSYEASTKLSKIQTTKKNRGSSDGKKQLGLHSFFKPKT